MTAQPHVDLVQVFCANFDSRLDFSGPVTRSRSVSWPSLSGLEPSVVMDARISRYTLEVFNLVLAGDGDHLIPEPLDFYAGLAVEQLASASAIARVLLHQEIALAQGSVEEVERAISRDLAKWRERAVARLGGAR